MDRTRKCVLIFKIKYIARRKTLWIDTDTSHSDLGVQDFYLLSFITHTPRIMVLNDPGIIIHLLYPAWARARVRRVRPVLRKSSGGSTHSWGRCVRAPSPTLDPTDPLEENWDTKFWVRRLHLINEEIQNAVTLPNSRDIWGTNCPQALLL